MSFETQVHELHRRLSRYDVEKDNAFSTAFFTERANALFGPLQDADLQNLRYEITNIMQTKRTPLPMIHKDRTIEWQIPECIKIAIQDSGVAPVRIHSRMRNYLVTPGTYLDTAPKTKINDLLTYTFFGFHSLADAIFQEIQMPIHSFSATLQTNKECFIQFMHKNKQVQVSFNAAQIPAGPMKEFFLGNTEKDKWFKGNPTNTIKSDIYILCKELGDLLQIVYGRLYMEHYNQMDSVCIFTCDKPASLRAQLLGVPSIILNENKKEQYMEDIYTFTQTSTDSAIKHFHFQHMSKNNASVISTINKVLLSGFYKNRYQHSIPLREPVRNYLRQIIQIIMNKTNDIMQEMHAPKCQTMTLEEFRQYIYTFQALPVFDSDHLIPYASTTRLFITYRNTQEESHHASVVGNLRRLLQQGGAEERMRYVKSMTDDDFTEILDSEKEYAPHTYLLNGIYTCLKQQLPTYSVDELCFLTDDIFIVLALMFDFTGGMCYHSDFLQPLVTEFLKTRFEMIDYEQFEKRLESWKETHLGNEYEPKELVHLNRFFTISRNRKTWKRGRRSF